MACWPKRFGRAGMWYCRSCWKTAASTARCWKPCRCRNCWNRLPALGRVHAELDQDGIARSIFLWEGVGARRCGRISARRCWTPPASCRRRSVVFRLPRPTRCRLPWCGRRSGASAFLGPPGHVQTLSYVQALTASSRPARSATRSCWWAPPRRAWATCCRRRVSGAAAADAGRGDSCQCGGVDPQRAPGARRVAACDARGRRPHGAGAPVLAAAPQSAWRPAGKRGGGSWRWPWRRSRCRAGYVWMPVSGALLAILLAYPVWSWRRLESAGRFLDHELKRLRQQLGPVADAQPKALSHDPFEARIQQVQVAAHRLRHLQTSDVRRWPSFRTTSGRRWHSALMQVDALPAAQSRLRDSLGQGLDAGGRFFAHFARGNDGRDALRGTGFPPRCCIRHSTTPTRRAGQGGATGAPVAR